MFKIKLYKYDSSQEANGYRGVGENDFSRFVAQGEDIGEDITQVLDTSEITLYGLPFQKAFDPETKFIADIIEYSNTQPDLIVDTKHLVVARDTPSQPILSDNQYFDHHISFIEPSVVAQKRLVDNISATYKLKDVSLEEASAYPDDIATINMSPSIYKPTWVEWHGVPDRFGVNDADFIVSSSNIQVGRKLIMGKYFALDGNLEMINSKGESYTTAYNNIDNFKDDDGKYRASFRIPKLNIWKGARRLDRFFLIGQASIDYTIKEFDPADDANPTKIVQGQFISNSNLSTQWDIELYRYYDNNFGVEVLDGEWLVDDLRLSGRSAGYGLDFYFRKYTDKTAPTPTYITSQIEIDPNKRYEITMSLHLFPDNLPSKFATTGDAVPRRYKFTGNELGYYFEQVYMDNAEDANPPQVYTNERYSPRVNRLNSSQTSGSGSFFTYDIDTAKIVYASSTPYSALALLQKAIINSGLYEKEDGVYIADVNNSNLPFYIDTAFRDELAATVVIENFYNQKNLWEIMVEVGNYIHSIPELKFGSNDRFMITFNRLGITEDDMETKLGGKVAYENKQKNATKISIFNSRSVEDYISATSSYIENMVQLGGFVEEWVAPKTNNESLLVSNDTCDIITSKPIIELLDIFARRNSDGAVAKITDYIYEENVYKTLSIDREVIPNRGIALYYKLGTNIITGGSYQLPQANANIYTDYTIKKVIWTAFHSYPVFPDPPISGEWTDLKVNDYSFFIRYKTKDSVRQNHIRPDLRKYLLNTQWDRYPEHNQFNNQTDVVIDSIKFGNNMIGKLIRTGNNSYDIYEWNDKWENVKHKGELYRINGELYYVAKVMHTIYNPYIISKVSYSKDYNELSNIIGIPSEPRFYEISEQSLIWREFEINDVILLTDDEQQLAYKSNYIFNYEHLAGLIVGEETDFAKYVVTVFKGDKDAGSYDQTVGEKDLYIEVINPINAYSSENTLTYEYDMADNYSAGNKVITTAQFDEAGNKPNKGSYNSLWAVKYTDIYGKSALMDFYILGNIGTPDITSPSGFTPPTPEETMAFPESPIKTKDPSDTNFIGKYDILATNVREFNTNFNGRGLGLLKDCREAISINYNLRMATNSDTFVLSPYVYLPKKSNVRLVLLAEEVNKFSSGYIDNSKIITPIDKQGNPMNPYFTFDIDTTTAPNSWDNTKQVVTQFGINLLSVFENVADEHFTNTEGYQRIKGIAIICDVSLDAGLETENPIIPYKTQFIVARNIPDDWDRAKALKKWSWGSPNKSQVFKNKQ